MKDYAELAKQLSKPGIRTSKLQLAFDALEFASGDVSTAKAIVAKQSVRIAARTWHTAIHARLALLNQ